jgi:hypothetical protein
LVHGRKRYFRAAREAVRSVLDHTGFDVFAAVGAGGGPRLPASARVRKLRLPATSGDGDRAAGFLLKFAALEQCLDATRARTILLLDADAVFVRRVEAAELDAALDGHPLGMVEQTGIRGSSMGRSQFLDHYVRHSLDFLAPGEPPPPLADFRFFNSGVVIGRREELASLVSWARARMAATEGEHRVGEHMIADQDYFQVWANHVRRNFCAGLDWSWNHCEHWDEPFPRAGARIAHFSNFCRGPRRADIGRMREARRGRLVGADARVGWRWGRSTAP